MDHATHNKIVSFIWSIADGYEISFNKYFYIHQPLRDLAEVVKEIRDLVAETEGLLERILNFES